MDISECPDDAMHLFLAKLTSRITDDSENQSDMYHLGKIILQSLKDAPNNVMQIDGATGLSETNKLALEKSVRCAISMQKYGLRCGDVVVLMAPNHVDLAAPFYAALYLGVAVAAVDRTLVVRELRDSFNIRKPKIIFCQSEKVSDIQIALNDLDLDPLIVTFDKGNYLCSFSEFLERSGDDVPVKDFKALDFNPEDTIALLISTSGTTGLPKCAALTHKNYAIKQLYLFSGRIATAMVHDPRSLHKSPILRYPRVQTSENFTPEHAYHLINTYRPTFSVLSPTAMTTLLSQPNRDECDFTCLEVLTLGGTNLPTSLVEEVKSLTPNTKILNIYGMSEIGIGFYADCQAPGSCGKPVGGLQYRIINIDTQEDINEPNIPGELWVKGPGVFKGYYNNPEATVETFAADEWFKTGDLFYRDENWNFFFSERIKLLLKYKSYQISPVEVENVIRLHPNVLDVAVTGIPDPECGDLPVACVVLRDGKQVTADEVKNLVKESLSDSKQLRGGVIFLSAIPQNPSTKVHRQKLKDMVLHMERL